MWSRYVRVQSVKKSIASLQIERLRNQGNCLQSTRRGAYCFTNHVPTVRQSKPLCMFLQNASSWRPFMRTNFTMTGSNLGSTHPVYILQQEGSPNIMLLVNRMIEGCTLTKHDKTKAAPQNSAAVKQRCSPRWDILRCLWGDPNPSESMYLKAPNEQIWPVYGQYPRRQLIISYDRRC